ncbi:MAG TPA: YbjN domain-containing protein [Nocardioidaceae bacterium]|nr:YbjN domain-containing protein [Nocardioidaceae bacterium]
MATLTASVYAWFEAYVGNRLLTVVEDGRRLARTDDGEWTVAVDGDELRVRIDREPYWSVEVYALAATGVRTRAAALREINALNARLASATVVLADGVVVVKQRVHADGLTENTLAQAVRAVAGVADDVALAMRVMHDGTAVFGADAAA